jgi:hypothetical protein
MTREVRIQKKGDGFTSETIQIRSNLQTEAQSVEAYRDLITTLQACIDSSLFRAHYNSPDRISLIHTAEGWVFEALTTEVQG